MKSKRVLIVGISAILVVAGVLVSHVLAADEGEKKACCGTCSGVEKTAATACGTTCGGSAQATAAHAAHAGHATHAAHAGHAAHATHAVHAAGTSAQQCPVSQFMTRLSRVDLSEAQIEKMLVIWKGTEKKLMGILTPVQMAKMNEPLPLQSVMAARVAAQVANPSQSQAACCGSCDGAAAKAASAACCGSCGGAQAKGCPADCTKVCCAK